MFDSIDWIVGIVCKVAFFIDSIIYGFIPKVYNFIYELANREFFSDGSLQKFASNIYIIVGIFMLFRLAFVLLNAIIDPDKLDNKDSGAIKIVSRLIVSLFLVIAIPVAFDYSVTIQKLILQKGLVEKIVLGGITVKNTGTASGSSDVVNCYYEFNSTDSAEFPEKVYDVAYTINSQSISVFSAPKSDVTQTDVFAYGVDYSNVASHFSGVTGPTLCPNDISISLSFSNQFAKRVPTINVVSPSEANTSYNINTTPATEGTANQAGGILLGRIALSSFFYCNPKVTTCTNDTLDFNSAFPTSGNSNFSGLSDKLDETAAIEDKEVHVVTYIPLLSTIVGGVILWLLIVFCFEVAMRVVKLGFLEMITPVAIIGYIQPKGEIFNKWLKMCISTYVNLFIRLFALSFALFIITTVVSSTNGSVSMANLFIVFGALMFAKEAPKLISGLFGIDEGSIKGLNPFAKMAGVGAMGLAASGAAKLGAGVAGGIGGLTGSAIRGGRGAELFNGIKAGASKGAAGVKMGTKPNFRNMVGGLAASGISGGKAGYADDHAVMSSMDHKLEANGGNAGELFKNDDFRDAFNEKTANKTALNTAKEELATQQNAVTNAQNRYANASNNMNYANSSYENASREFLAAQQSRDNAMTKAQELKSKLDSSAIGTADYITNSQNYNDYVSSQSFIMAADTTAGSIYANASDKYTAASTTLSSTQAEYTAAQTDLTSATVDLQTKTKNVADATSAFEKSEKKLNAQKEIPSNKKDAETLKTYERGKDSGIINH